MIQMKSLFYGLTALMLGVSAQAHTITITEPKEDRAYHRPAQVIEVSATTSRLPDGYTSAILLNGKVVSDGLTASIPTLDLEPNAYTVSAIIMDKSAKTVAKDERMVYVIQRAHYANKRKDAIKAREDYEALPLYRKLAIGINPNKHAPPKVDETTPTWQIQ